MRSVLDVHADQAAAYGKESEEQTGRRKSRARLGKVAAPRIISLAPRVIERGEEEEKDADVDVDGDINPDIEMPRHSDLDGRASGHAP